jgi:ABC-type lipoprotein export system ATPase subunit
MIAGLSGEAQNAVTVVGPTGSGFSRVLSASDTLSELVPGPYTIQASVASNSAGLFAPKVATQQVEVLASDTAQISVEYAITTGVLP